MPWRARRYFVHMERTRSGVLSSSRRSIAGTHTTILVGCSSCPSRPKAVRRCGPSASKPAT
eukprot:1184955-Lingulodinium_polyedra.AAC.1